MPNNSHIKHYANTMVKESQIQLCNHIINPQM